MTSKEEIIMFLTKKRYEVEEFILCKLNLGNRDDEKIVYDALNDLQIFIDSTKSLINSKLMINAMHRNGEKKDEKGSN